jgi:cyanophycin synthetase
VLRLRLEGRGLPAGTARRVVAQLRAEFGDIAGGGGPALPDGLLVGDGGAKQGSGEAEWALACSLAALLVALQRQVRDAVGPAQVLSAQAGLWQLALPYHRQSALKDLIPFGLRHFLLWLSPEKAAGPAGRAHAEEASRLLEQLHAGGLAPNALPFAMTAHVRGEALTPLESSIVHSASPLPDREWQAVGAIPANRDADRKLPLFDARRLIVLDKPDFEPGYWRGMRQPAVVTPVLLTRPQVSGSALGRFDTLRQALFPVTPDQVPPAPMAPWIARHPVLGRVAGLCLDLLGLMRMPVMAGVSGVPPEPDNPRSWRLALPAISAEIPAPQEALIFACGLFNDFADGAEIGVAAPRAAMERLRQRYQGVAPAGDNTLLFLQAAYDLDIPWHHIANNVYQFGWGRHGRWLDSSFTDRTSTISAALARDKVASAKVLRKAGLPVPWHRLVSTAEYAVQAAAALGYPVVVKPANLDGGQGVMVGLRTAEAVRSAFDAAARLSKRVLVEQFIEGSDFRFRVCNGEAHGVVFRHPASVIGDGTKTIKALIDQTNLARQTQPAPSDPTVESGRKSIEIDDEVIAWLEHQGLCLESIVPSGQRVRLRGAANASLGGTRQLVPMERAHPDNLLLAVNAAAALRLDVAGIDVLLPDITRSFKETGGAICEVNAKPQITSGKGCHQVLRLLINQQGRIPIVLLTGKSAHPELGPQVVEALRTLGKNVRWLDTGDECRHALLNTTVDAIVWAPRSWPSLGIGLPFDRIDLWVELGSGVESEPHPWADLVQSRWTIDIMADGTLAVADRLIAWLAQVMLCDAVEEAT